jgi:transposase
VVIWLGSRMRDDDGRKLDHKTLEQLRIRTVRQIEQGAHPADVAAALGMTKAAVYGWLAKYREGGLDALMARPVPGRPPKLSGAKLQRVYTLVVGNDPRQLRFAFALGTSAMVRELVRREFGVRWSEVSVGRLLRKLGLSPQRPLYRAWQQNPEAVARWKDEEYRRSARRPLRWAPRSTSPMRPGCARTTRTTMRAPHGRRSGRPRWWPGTGERFGVNLISAVTAKGALRFAPTTAT